MKGWVLHVLVFIVCRQIVPLGEPARRSYDACESLGSNFKKVIRFLTCRRRASKDTQHEHRSNDGKKLWKQTFRRG